MAETITHESKMGPWFEVRWAGDTAEVFGPGEEQDARAYAAGLAANGGPLFDEEEGR